MSKFLYVTLVAFVLALPLFGCSVAESGSESDYASADKVSTYKSSTADGRFKVVSKQTIDDGTNNRLTIKVLVDKDTRVMYMQTEMFQAGYGIGLQVMCDANGKPLLYKESLDE